MSQLTISTRPNPDFRSSNQQRRSKSFTTKLEQALSNVRDDIWANISTFTKGKSYFHNISRLQDSLSAYPSQTLLSELVQDSMGSLEILRTQEFDPKKVPPVTVVGAGLCGLTLATALNKVAVKCNVYEARSEEKSRIRPNNVQLRGDYRNSQEPFVLMDTLHKLLPEEIVKQLQEAATPFNQDFVKDGLPVDRFLISVGHVQNVLTKHLLGSGVPIHYDSPCSDATIRDLSSDKSILVVDCRGPQKDRRSASVIEMEAPICTEHHWLIDLDAAKFGETDWNGNRKMHLSPAGFLAKRHLVWDKAVSTQQALHHKTFSRNLCQRSHDASHDESTKEKLRAFIQGVDEGAITAFSYALCHRVIDSSDFDSFIDGQMDVLHYPLTTKPNVSVPKLEGPILVGDSLVKPHPMAAHGMLGGFKSILAFMNHVQDLGRDCNDEQEVASKEVLTATLAKIAVDEMQTLFFVYEQMSATK